MAFPRAFLDEVKSRITVSSVVGKRVRLVRRGREFVGLSPFKQERTPSFTVNDDKQFYHCFATGKHGSIFDFLMETEGLSFIESVSQLARMAGVPIPVADPKAAARAAHAKTLIDVAELAARWFQTQLMEVHGENARAYLAKRNISRQLIEAFQIGYAPDSRNGLISYLATQDVSAAQMSEVGLSITPDDHKSPYDRFRHRVMFPIHDVRGRVIAFGGRALNQQVPAKYLNSPETPLFHKGRMLYNFARARQPAYDTKQLLVVEGYMDVIGLARADIAHCVAPLGTAITPAQIELLWRIAPEPILCMDGDEAGLRAAYRVVERALPLLRPGYSLRFVLLPHGKDPDDMIAEGHDIAFMRLIAQAHSLIDILWRREISHATYKTPEQKAALKQQLHQAIRSIANEDIRRLYYDEINERLYQLFKPIRRSFTRNQYGRSHDQSNNMPYLVTRQSAAATGISDIGRGEALIVQAVLMQPQLLDKHFAEFEQMAVPSVLLGLRFAIIDYFEAYEATEKLDTSTLIEHLRACGYGDIIDRLNNMIRNEKFMFLQKYDAQNKNDDEYGDYIKKCEAEWLEIIDNHRYMTLKRERDEIRAECAQTGSERDFQRLAALVEQIQEYENKSLNNM